MQYHREEQSMNRGFNHSYWPPRSSVQLLQERIYSSASYSQPRFLPNRYAYPGNCGTHILPRVPVCLDTVARLDGLQSSA